MAITLGGVSLPDAIILEPFEHPGIHASAEDTIGGGKIIQEFSRLDFRNIDLYGEEDIAWITHLTLESLRTIAMVASATYTLVYETNSWLVRFRHEDSPVVYAEPIIPKVIPLNTDYYNNLWIKLMKVG
jgi:hypothetical protein